MEVIPAIDLLDGQCVRLYQGDFNKVSGYTQDPVALANSYREAGMRRLHVVDLDGARTGSPANMPLIKAMAATGGVAVQAGGGIRDLQRAQASCARPVRPAWYSGPSPPRSRKPHSTGSANSVPNTWSLPSTCACRKKAIPRS
jgi:phosphoribosylformimino-5-aminoimidazole carboxamide ribonucleotide (ProFAR) isomerase